MLDFILFTSFQTPLALYDIMPATQYHYSVFIPEEKLPVKQPETRSLILKSEICFVVGEHGPINPSNLAPYCELNPGFS